MGNAVLFFAFALAAIPAAAQANGYVNADISVTLREMQSHDCEQQEGALSRAQELLASDDIDAQGRGRLREGLIQMLSGENARVTQPQNDINLQYGRPKACPGGDEENDPEFLFYSDVVTAVARLDDERAIPALAGAIKMDAAEESLMKYGDKALGPALEQLNSPDEWTRLTALRVGIGLLRIHQGPDSRTKIRELIHSRLADPAGIVRRQAVKEISCLSDRQEYVPMLEQVAKTDPLKLPGKADDGGDGEEFYPVRYDARGALREIRNGESCIR